MKILYVHGFGSNENSVTGKSLKRILSNHEVITKTFDLLNVKMLPGLLRKFVISQKIDLVIGSSLGGFYTLTLGDVIPKIVINPCMRPSLVMDKIDSSITPEVLSDFEKLESKIYADIDADTKEYTYGIFSSNDELFSFKRFFETKYIRNHTLTVSGGHHRLTESQLEKVLETFEHTFDLIKIHEPAALFESFVNLYSEDPKMNKFDQFKDEVYEILEKSYEPVGGILGVSNPDDIVSEGNFWKLFRKSGKIIACAIYKLSGNKRKMKYLGTDGTREGKDALNKIIADDIRLIDRGSWIESSHAVERKFQKMGATPIPAEVVKILMPGKEFVKIHEDGFHYDRVINGVTVTKIAFGNVNQ